MLPSQNSYLFYLGKTKPEVNLPREIFYEFAPGKSVLPVFNFSREIFTDKCMENLKKRFQAPVPERPLSANPGLKVLFYFCIYLPMH